MDALLGAAREEFAAQGVDVNVRAIAARAGVGTATLYRHFPRRSDLVNAVFDHELKACAAEASRLSDGYEPGPALDRWIDHYATFVASKRGLAAALHFGDPAFAGVSAAFQHQLRAPLQALLEQAAAAGQIRSDVDPLDLLSAVAKLCIPPIGTDDSSRARRMIALLLDGLRYGARAPLARRTHRDGGEFESSIRPLR